MNGVFLPPGDIEVFRLSPSGQRNVWDPSPSWGDTRDILTPPQRGIGRICPSPHRGRRRFIVLLPGGGEVFIFLPMGREGPFLSSHGRWRETYFCPLPARWEETFYCPPAVGGE